MQDMLGRVDPRFSRHDFGPGVWLASILVVIFWAGFLYTGTISSLWPLLGIANQLLATTALAVGTAVILRMHPTATTVRAGHGDAHVGGGCNDADCGLAVDLDQLQPRSQPGEGSGQLWVYGDTDGIVFAGFADAGSPCPAPSGRGAAAPR
jgi:hypothetical protein